MCLWGGRGRGTGERKQMFFFFERPALPCSRHLAHLRSDLDDIICDSFAPTEHASKVFNAASSCKWTNAFFILWRSASCRPGRWRFSDHCWSQEAGWCLSEQLSWSFVACWRFSATEELTPPGYTFDMCAMCWQLASPSYFTCLYFPTFDHHPLLPLFFVVFAKASFCRQRPWTRI